MCQKNQQNQKNQKNRETETDQPVSNLKRINPSFFRTFSHQKPFSLFSLTIFIFFMILILSFNIPIPQSFLLFLFCFLIPPPQWIQPPYPSSLSHKTHKIKQNIPKDTQIDTNRARGPKNTNLKMSWRGIHGCWKHDKKKGGKGLWTGSGRG